MMIYCCCNMSCLSVLLLFHYWEDVCHIVPYLSVCHFDHLIYHLLYEYYQHNILHTTISQHSYTSHKHTNTHTSHTLIHTHKHTHTHTPDHDEVPGRVLRSEGDCYSGGRRNQSYWSTALQAGGISLQYWIVSKVTQKTGLIVHIEIDSTTTRLSLL